MPNTLRLAALTLAALAAAPAAALGAGRTETIRVYEKNVSFKLTHADGTVETTPPEADPKPGDVLDIDSLNFRGDHRRHAKRFYSTTHLRCEFTTTGEPDCISHVAIGGSMMVWHGNTLVDGIGRFAGATGRVLKLEEVPGGNDVVARVRLR